ncbi:uncharacterized protein ASPGLDRAFT_1471639 [Aspergillus glaucus CBS 516.65]|uniref:Uncharacterized protein n=1 Tax=Aspergillus glaucus CBS 516.65 TaxID=1160497 RepID=A0A1L9VLI5_ASPGL|nr:hypothetical protein ASPGLDRAFT_1471639 [Aspergillus glaucus CBS 516.65]OJJ84773.1 hypothetical protein ASPGLDRAFT_1471639 [Aspergillus glaucus CBS 516.65]
MPTYLILNSDQALPKSLYETLLRRANTTLLAATRYLTPEVSSSFFHLPKHDSSLVIPVKIDLLLRYDAAGAVRGFLFAGVTHVDAVVLQGGRGVWRGGSCGSCGNGVSGGVNGDVGKEGEYEEGLRRLFRQVRMFLERSRVVLLGSGTDVPGVRDVVMTEVGDVASFIHASDIPDGDGPESATDKVLQLIDGS